MKVHDAIVIGGGVIGLSIALELRKRGLSVLVIERGEPGREASHAAAGMLVGAGDEFPPALRALAKASAAMYPVFVRELEDASNLKIDFRGQGTILLSAGGHIPEFARRVSTEDLSDLEPSLRHGSLSAAFLPEHSVDPRSLMHALSQAAKHREVDVASGSPVENMLIENGGAAGVKTSRSSYPAKIVVNCAGAWTGQIGPQKFPVRPVKGQMLAVIGGPPLEHVIRGEKVYLLPRSDGRIVIGSTLEEAGFDKQTDVDTIEKLLRSATQFVPALAKARQHEAWAGLRPATPDLLPILGETSIPGYFVASGHYRDGILLAPATAKALAELITDGTSAYDLSAFSPERFE